MIDVGRIEIAAAIIEGHDFFECLKMAVMKIWTPQANVAQAGRAKLADVVRVPGHLEAAGVFSLRTHADVVKRIVAKQITGVTDIATPCVKDALTACFGSPEGRDLLHTQIKRRPI